MTRRIQSQATPILVGLLALTLVAIVAPVRAADLTVTVDGIENAKGRIYLGLFNEPNEWPKGKAYSRIDVPASAGHLVYVFKDVPPGRYALTGFHDEYNTGDMEYNFLGLPKEGFLFSNDVAPRISAPGFERCAIDVADKPVAITVHIQHWGLSH